MHGVEPTVYDGAVMGGVVVLSEGRHLPEGTKVTVVPKEEPQAVPDIESIYDMAKLAVPTGIPDLSVNIDHYLYGHPKVRETQP